MSILLYKHKTFILISFLAFVMCAMFLLPPIRQNNIAEHLSFFQPTYSLFKIINMAAFIVLMLTGIKGLIFLCSQTSKSQFIFQWEKTPYMICFICLSLASFSLLHSYQLHHSSITIAISNLLMTSAIMSLLSAIMIEHFLQKKFAYYLLAIFLFIGFISSIYWDFNGNSRNIDFRLYHASQFIAIGCALILAALFSRHYLNKTFLITALISLFLAKTCELLSKFIYNNQPAIYTGNIIKNILIAIALLSILLYLEKRKAILRKV